MAKIFKLGQRGKGRGGFSEGAVEFSKPFGLRMRWWRARRSRAYLLRFYVALVRRSKRSNLCSVKLNCRWTWLLALGWVLTGSGLAQPLVAERQEFDSVRARAEKGDVQAQLSLGTYYASGHGVARDPGKAVKWHRKAAEQGLAAAQYLLATEYLQGTGVKRDPVEAARWYRRAAEQKLPEAQFALGQCYALGAGVNQDDVQAVEWYRKAAEQNYLEAIGEIGQSYLEGTGLATDIVEGLKWTRRGAEMGYAPAQNRLGVCYLKGEGVTKDLVQAYKWFNLSAAQGGTGVADVKMNLARAESSMTPEQVTEAQRLTREFKRRSAADSTSPTFNLTAAPSANSSPVTVGGQLNVDAGDKTCDVYVDGAFVGNPPAKLHLAEGSHVVEVKKPGFTAYRKEIKVSNGAELSLNVSLEKQ